MDNLEILYYVWGTKPIDFLCEEERENFNEDLHMVDVTEEEYLDYARKAANDPAAFVKSAAKIRNRIRIS